MRLVFFPANQAWAFVFGEDVVQVLDFCRFFLLRGDAVLAAGEAGLSVSRLGVVCGKGC